jgi:predicted metal-binding membrane protein
MRRPLLAYGFGHAPWPHLFAVAAGGLLVAELRADAAMLPGLCGPGLAARLAMRPDEAWAIVLAFNAPSALVADWFVMLVAMMPPLLALALLHVWRSVLPRHRALALACFLSGYVAMWLVAGIPLVATALWLALLTSGGPALPLVALGLALLWSASPWQRAALNRGHRVAGIAALGASMSRDACRFGLQHGAWCVASCWAWMLVPLAGGRWHVPAMALCALAMLADRLSPPGRPRWRRPAILGWLAPTPRLRPATALVPHS